MDKHAADAFATLMKEAAKTHPLFAGIDPQKTAQMTDDMTKTLQAILSPQGLGNWMQSWMAYQTEMARLEGRQGSAQSLDRHRSFSGATPRKICLPCRAR
ncbi:hypothetical protein [Sulfitobacter sp. PM12]|uniref:hypothetical protein n=1 Tax=Sulfitobacter sp. PM12 TaxID=3138497 RepID=UPI003890A4BE